MIPNTEITVTLTPELRLKQALKQAGVKDPAMVTKLTVMGNITCHDFAFIRKNMNKTLQELDMSGASVIKNRINRSMGFSQCTALTSVIIPNSVTRIGGAFSFCAKLTSIIIPNSVTEIGIFAFSECSSLTSVILSASVKKIKELAFSGTSIVSFTVHPDNLFFTSEDGVLFNKDKTKLIEYPKGRQGNYVIPNGVTKIRDYAFSGCRGLNSIVIPKSVTKIGRCAFSYCGLKSVAISASVRKIGYRAFCGCSELVNITVQPENAVYVSQDGVLFNKNKTELMAYPAERQEKHYIIPNSVTKISYGAFNFAKLISLAVPSSIIEMEVPWEFENCTDLTSINIYDSIQEIEKHPFVNKNDAVLKFATRLNLHLQSDFSSENGVLFNQDKTTLICYPQGRQGDYVIPDSVKTIGDYAFSNCPGLTSITIPDSVIKIEYRVFHNCTGLTSVTIPASVIEIEDLNWNVDFLKDIIVFVHPDNPVYESVNGKLEFK